MKKLTNALFLVIFLLTGHSSLAQNRQYISGLYKIDSVGVDSLVKNIVLLSGKNYIFNSRQEKRGVISYLYECNGESRSELIVTFGTKMVGENRDLGIKGNKVYVLKSVYGNFLDLYLFWKNKIGSKFSAEELTKNIVGETILTDPNDSHKRIKFMRYNDLTWSIDCW